MENEIAKEKKEEKVKNKKINIKPETKQKIKNIVFSVSIIIVLFLLAAAEAPKTVRYRCHARQPVRHSGDSDRQDRNAGERFR